MKINLIAMLVLVVSVSSVHSHDLRPDVEMDFPDGYTIKTPLPQLAEEIAMTYALQSKDILVHIEGQQLVRSIESNSQFRPLPQQNTWVVLGVLVAFVVVILLANVVFGGS